jgi:hypothetical protein
MLIFPEVVLYTEINFGGAEARINYHLLDLHPFWNDSISSVIVVSGTWQFFESDNWQGVNTTVLPGWYSSVEKQPFNMVNDTISSFKIISWDPQGDNPVVV